MSARNATRGRSDGPTSQTSPVPLVSVVGVNPAMRSRSEMSSVVTTSQ